MTVSRNQGRAYPLVLAVIALLTAFVTNADRLAYLWQVFRGPPPPPPSNDWKHFATKNQSQLEAYLNRAGPSPTNLAAFSAWPVIHIWHRGPKTNTAYKVRTLPYKNEPNPSVNYFFNDGTIVPIGFAFGYPSVVYLEVIKGAQ